MSLKAKLEAVIYAAEEPVTLAQLAMLFSNEALEWKAEQQVARVADETRDGETSAAETAELPLEAVEPLELAAEPGGESGPPDESVPADANGPADASVPDANPEAGTAEPESAESAAAEEGQAAEPTADAVAEPDAAAIEAEARRAARQREREVRAILREILDEIIATYAADGRGVEIREIAGGYRMATKPECHDAVRLFVKSLKPALKLSLPALETLAVIAYKQPVTAPEVNEVRGVDSSGVFGSLLARKLIATAGRKQVIGRPILYKTTKEFLLRFGLKDIAELPSMEEFEKMAASELEELGSGEQETGDVPAAAADGQLGERTSEGTVGETASEDEAGASAAGSELDSEAGSGAGTEPESETGDAAEPLAESPETQSESNPSEAARLNAEPSAE